MREPVVDPFLEWRDEFDNNIGDLGLEIAVARSVIVRDQVSNRSTGQRRLNREQVAHSRLIDFIKGDLAITIGNGRADLLSNGLGVVQQFH